MNTNYGTRYGSFRFFTLPRFARSDDVWLDGICDAASLGISSADENFIYNALKSESPRLLAVVGKDRSPLFVITGLYPSAGAVAAFVCDLSLRDFCEMEELFDRVDASPRFRLALKDEGCRATSRGNATVAAETVERLSALAGFTNVNVELWPYSNDASTACMCFTRTAALLCGCSVDTNFLYPCGVPVKMFDRGVFAAFIIGALNCAASDLSSDVRLELEFYLDGERRFFARALTDGRIDEIYFRVASDAASRAGVPFFITDRQVIVSPTREENSLLGVKVRFRIAEAPHILSPPPLPDFLKE